MNPKKILIIDDDLFISDIYSTTFKKAGFEVSTANNGVDGLAKVQSEKPDLVLLDIIMPGENGLEILQKMRADDSGQALKILMLTNMRDEETVKKGLDLGANGYLIKATLTPGQVVNEVNRTLSESL